MSFKKEDCGDGMHNIALHRAESLIKPPDEFTSEDTKAISEKQDNPSKITSILSVLKQFKIEVVMFLYMFSYIIRGVSSTDMIIKKVCLVHLGYPEDICYNLTNHSDKKNEVEILANNLSLVHSLIHILPSAILGCFIGAWSDRYGRKIPLIMALLGILIDGLGTIICAAYLYSRAEFYFIPALFTGFSGGFVSVLTVIYSYVSDITTVENRTMKYAFMEMTFGIAMPLGTLAGGFIYKYGGYVPVFMTSAAGHLIGVAWVLFVLEETTGLDNKDDFKTKFMAFWSVQPVIDSYRATMKLRPNKGRKQILLLMSSMSIVYLTYAATARIDFLYVFKIYDWDNTTFSTVSSIFSVSGILCMLIAVPVFKRMGLGDPALGIVGSASLVLKYIGVGLAKKKATFLLANFAGLFAALSSLAGRSRISKLASKNDLGKIFAFLATAESFLPIIAMGAIAEIFNLTIEIYPGMMYLVVGCILLFPFGVYVWLFLLPKINYEEMRKDTISEVESTADNKNTDIQKY